MSKKTQLGDDREIKEREILGHTTSPLVSLAKASSSALLRAPSIVFVVVWCTRKEKEGTLALSCCVTKHLD